jgi:hypothetical protein
VLTYLEGKWDIEGKKNKGKGLKHVRTRAHSPHLHTLCTMNRLAIVHISSPNQFAQANRRLLHLVKDIAGCNRRRALFDNLLVPSLD